MPSRTLQLPSPPDPAPQAAGRRPSLALVAPPFAGHLNPLIALGKRLAARGHPVRFVTGPRKRSLIESCGFAVDTVSNDDPGALERIAETPYPVRNHPVRLARQLRANLALMPTLRRELDDAFDRHPPDLVIADFCAPIAGWSAQERGLPWITTIPSPCALETRHGTPSYCGGWGPTRHLGHRLRDAAGRTVTRGFKRGVSMVLAPAFRRAGVRIYRADGTEAAYSPQAILGLGAWELELERDWPAAFTMIGPVTESPEPSELPLELPEVEPSRLVLVSVGTHLPWAKRHLAEQTAALARSFPQHHFVVTLGSLDRASERPSEQAANVSVYPYVNYDRHLDRFGAVIHHAGTGLVYSALRAGLPCLAWPQDYDQFDVSARIVARGVGLRVHRLGDRASVRALSTLLHDFDHAPLEAMSRALAVYDPFAATAAIVDRLTAPGASALASRPGTYDAPGGL